MDIERLKQLKAYYETLDKPESFDMSHIILKTHCGTVCCFAGQTCLMFGGYTEEGLYQSYWQQPLQFTYEPFDVAVALLDLTEDQADSLFYVYAWPTDLRDKFYQFPVADRPRLEPRLSSDSSTRKGIGRGTMEICRISVPGNLTVTAPNNLAGRHPMTIHRREEKARRDARYAWIEAGRPKAAGRVRVSLLLYQPRKFDAANIWAAVKGHLDGLFKEAITEDDRPEFLELGGIEQQTGREYLFKAEIVFIVEAADR